MNKGEEFTVRKLYVEKILHTAMKPKRGFDYIKYARDAVTDREFVRIADKRGTHITLEITAEPLEDVMTDLFTIALFGIVGKHDRLRVPGNIITDGAELLEIAPLFNNERRAGYGL